MNAISIKRQCGPMGRCLSLCLCLGVCLMLRVPAAAQSDPAASEKSAAAARDSQVRRSVARLVQIQEDDGGWPYEGVYRVQREIPVGYRIGGTAIVCTALMYSPADDQAAVDKAIGGGVELILKELEHPLMKPSTENRYDVRVWGHIYALDFFCRLQGTKRLGDAATKVKASIQKLVDILIEEEIEGGGWNYANRRSHASFVTAPAVQALLFARSVGAKVPDDVFARSADILKKSRTKEGAFQYSGILGQRRGPEKLPGSIARSANCEATLIMLGQGSQAHLQAALDAFHEHWDELEKRRKKTGTHKPPFNVAPYYFYYGHRYAAQAIELLAADDQDREWDRYRAVLLKTRDDDDTWNDRVFDRSKAFGTAMAVLSLQTTIPRPPQLKQKAAGVAK